MYDVWLQIFLPTGVVISDSCVQLLQSHLQVTCGHTPVRRGHFKREQAILCVCVRPAVQNVLHSARQLQSQYVATPVSCRTVWMTAAPPLLLSDSAAFTVRLSPFRLLINHLLYKVIAIPGWNEPWDKKLWWAWQHSRPCHVPPCILNRAKPINMEFLGQKRARL